MVTSKKSLLLTAGHKGLWRARMEGSVEDVQGLSHARPAWRPTVHSFLFFFKRTKEKGRGMLRNPSRPVPLPSRPWPTGGTGYPWMLSTLTSRPSFQKEKEGRGSWKDMKEGLSHASSSSCSQRYRTEDIEGCSGGKWGWDSSWLGLCSLLSSRQVDTLNRRKHKASDLTLTMEFF